MTSEKIRPEDLILSKLEWAKDSLKEEDPEYQDTDLRKELFLRFYGEDFNEEQKNKILKHLANT